MKVKKLLTTILVVVMIISSLDITAFASEETLPNFEGMVYVGNYDCENKADGELSISITKGETEIIAPLEYDAEMEMYYIEGVVDGIDAVIEEVGPAYEEAMKNWDTSGVMESCGYEVALIDASGHFWSDDITVDVLTYDSLKETLEFLMEALNEMIKEFDPEYEGYSTFDELLAAYEEMLKDPEMEMTEEEIAEEMAAINEYKDMADQLEAGTYAGMLMVSSTAKCGCSVLASNYNVYREYYDADGQYVAQEMLESTPVGNGTVIKIEDLLSDEFNAYEGVEYEFEGAYVYSEELGDWDLENPITEFEVFDDGESFMYTEVLLKYVPADDGQDDVIVDENDDETNIDNNKDDVNKSEVADVEETETKAEVEKTDESGVPETGDSTNIALYALLMVAAVFGLKKIRA